MLDIVVYLIYPFLQVVFFLCQYSVPNFYYLFTFSFFVDYDTKWYIQLSPF
jgi:hypothetical protein